MGDYSVTLKFKATDLQSLNDGHHQIYFAENVIDGQDTCTMQMMVDHIAENVQLSWKAEYSIAAFEQAIFQSVKSQLTTASQNIQFQHTYTLLPNWTGGKIEQDPTLSKNTFRFINTSETPAAAVVHKVIDGKLIPFYVSHILVPPGGGSETLTPTPKCAVWVGQNVTQPSAAVTKNISDVFVVDMTDENVRSAEWDGSKFTLIPSASS